MTAGIKDRMRERLPLSIPAFASRRCRDMTEELIMTLEAIPPIDDQALEDRALACFVVACGELALMTDAAQRETIVAQLTDVARKLVASATKRQEEETIPVANVELMPRVGMTWDQVEAVLKREQTDRRRF
jgi:hypothetical protein